ncbi:MAG: hypothetical protein AB8U25_00355 [Rickettsiales endosymbiont of Dermacentor nuttalli]
MVRKNLYYFVLSSLVRVFRYILLNNNYIPSEYPEGRVCMNMCLNSSKTLDIAE